MEHGAACLKRHLGSGKPTVGSWITLGHVGIAEIMANAGYDWLVVDLEHSTISTDMAGELIRVIDLCGVAPLVRVTSNHPDQIKRMMDAGAHGIIVPMVKSAREAKEAVAAVYYPTKGNRSVGLARAQGYGSTFSEYLKWLEEHAVVIVQIEHIDAVRNVEEILSVEGVDGYIVGPYDLSASMGMPGQLNHPEVVEAIEKVRHAAKAIGKPGGVHIVEPDVALLKQSVSDGFTFMAYSVDIRLLDVGCRAGSALMGGMR